MADKKTISIKPNAADLQGLYGAFKRMDADANGRLKTEVASISAWTQQGLIASSYNAVMPMQAAVVAKTVKFNRDRIPNVSIGGARGRASGGATAGELVMGNEFGANPTSVNGAFPNGGRRFPYRNGNVGNWIFPALKGMQGEITRRWKTAVEGVLNEWSKD